MSQEAGGSSVRLIVRIVVGVALIAVLIAAILDFQAKGKFTETREAITAKLDGEAKEGIPVADIPALIVGDPSVEGDLKSSPEVTYTWKLLRSYKVVLTVVEDGSRRLVTSMSSE